CTTSPPPPRGFHKPPGPGSQSREDIHMASIRREVSVAAGPAVGWDASRDVGAVHERLAPGFVVDTKLEEGARIVTFGNGMVARELIVDVDDEARRVVWAGVGGRFTHPTR